MTKMNDIQMAIQDKLQELIGAELRNAGRAVGLIWFLFVQKKVFGQELATYEEELRLHIQCSWRITQGKTILVASNDRFYPKGEPHQEDKSFDWTVPLSNRCDERISRLFADKAHNNWIVSAIKTDQFGGFEVKFGRNRRLSLFPDDSLGEEYWRIFGADVSQKHFVVTGKGIMLE